METAFDRYKKQTPQCPFGLNGVCCRNCLNGPCRITPKADKGVCGADEDLIVARNFLRSVAAGLSAHADHAREVVLAFIEILRKKANYKLRGTEKFKELQKVIAKTKLRIAYEALEDFRRQHGIFLRSEGKYLHWLKFVPRERIKVWKKLGILPLNLDLESSHALHQTVMGCNADPKDVWLQVLKLGIADFVAMKISTDFQDMIFGMPKLCESYANFGVLKDDYVNLAVHGHVPLLSYKIVEWSRKLQTKAKQVGAKGVNVVGVCCTGNELTERFGIPLAAHVLQQEMIIATGAVEAMIVDLQCIFPALSDVCACYHTKLITTVDFVKIPGAEHIVFNVRNADVAAKRMVELAIENYPKRGRYEIPNLKTQLIAGFNESLPIIPLLARYIRDEKIKLAFVVGCRNVKNYGYSEKLLRKLVESDYLVCTTGCIAHTAAQLGMMSPSYEVDGNLKKFLDEASKKLKMRLPPVWHFGSCVDNSRLIMLAIKLAKKLRVSLPKLNVLACAPEAASEKALAIASAFLAFGFKLHVAPKLPISGKIANETFASLPELTGAEIVEDAGEGI